MCELVSGLVFGGGNGGVCVCGCVCVCVCVCVYEVVCVETSFDGGGAIVGLVLMIVCCRTSDGGLVGGAVGTLKRKRAFRLDR